VEASHVPSVETADSPDPTGQPSGVDKPGAGQHGPDPTAGALPAGPVAAGPVTAGPVTAGPVTAGPVTAGPVTAGSPATGDLGAGRADHAGAMDDVSVEPAHPAPSGEAPGDRPVDGVDEPASPSKATSGEAETAPDATSEKAATKPARARPKGTRSVRAAREPAVDATCAAAVDIARAAAVEEAGGEEAVGEHLGAEAEGDRLVLHRFACTSRAYPGWAWTVVVTRAPRTRKVTVDDVVLMPHDGALLTPVWIPWSQRLRPGDVGVGDLLPTAADDPRLALRVTDVEEFVDTDAFLELGLGRPRVLSTLGRDETCDRWYSGEPGPDASIAKVAPATCLTCGFHVRLSGALGRLFGVCANELAPDDARVTSVDHGCGAHSEALVAPSAHPEPVVFEDDPGGAVPGDVELVGVGSGAGTDPEVTTPDDDG
jgi:hypothetical protein